MNNMDHKVQSIVESLLIKTRDGKAMWRESSRYGEYLLLMQDSTITISNISAQDSGFILNIFNNTGNLVINYKADNSNVNFLLLNNLYLAVVEYYNKVDTTLLSIINQLNSSEIIGDR